MTEVQRLRIVFAKRAALKYISHLDLMRTWERALRRARFPMAHTLGFNPRPRILFAAALAVGCSGCAEVLDVFLEQRMELREAAGRLPLQLPAGLEAVSVAEVELTLPALPAQVVAAEYRVVVDPAEPLAQVEERVSHLLAATAIPRSRARPDGVRHYDLRPLIQELSVSGCEGGACILRMRLQADGRASGRPDEVMAALGMEPLVREMERVGILVRDVA